MYDIVTSQCFIAGTLVLTEDGEKPIEEIEVGDYVYASDPETGESGYKEVLQTFVNESSELVHIHINGDEIVSTPTHPFYSPQRGWTSAINLRAGDILVLSNGEYVVVEKVQHEILEAPVKVYNFEVQDFHTYYVGKNSVLVHNTCETLTWNEFQKQNPGKTSSENSAEWAKYKKEHFKNNGQHYLHRPYIRQSVIDEINRNTIYNSDGLLYDSISDMYVDPKSVELGHMPDHEFWYERNRAEALGWTQAQFNDYMNNPEFYAWQNIHENRIHLHESKHL